MLTSFRRPLGKRETLSLSVPFAEHTLALIGDFATADICFWSPITTVPIITSKTGRLTFPISGYQWYGFPRAPRITSSRNSWIPFIPCYSRDPITLRIPSGPVSNLHSTPSSRTYGRLWIILAFWKYWRYQQNCGIIGTQSSDVTNVVIFWTLSMNRKRVGEGSTVSKG